MQPTEMYVSSRLELLKDVRLVQFSKCGSRFILGNEEGQVKIFKTNEMVEVFFDSLLYQVRAVCFDRNWCFYGSNNIVKGINLKSHKQYHLDINDIECIQFTRSYKEQLILLGSVSTIHIYSFKMKVCELKVGRLVGMLGMENTLLSMNKDGDVNFHYLDVFSEYATIQVGNEKGLKCMSYYMNLAILDEDGKVSILEIKHLRSLQENFQKQNFRSLETGNLLMTECTQKEVVNELYLNEISRMNCSSEELLVVGQVNGMIAYWDSIQLLGFYRAHEGAVANIEFYKEEVIVSTSRNELMMFDTSKKTQQYARMCAEIVSVQFKNNQMLIALGNGQLSLWTINAEIKLKLEQDYGEEILEMQFNPISSIIAVSQPRKIRLLFYYSSFADSIFKDIHTIEHPHAITTIHFLSSHILAYADHHHLHFFNIHSLQVDNTLPLHMPVHSLAFHPHLIVLNGHTHLQLISHDGLTIARKPIAPIHSCVTTNTILVATSEKLLRIPFDYNEKPEQDYHSHPITALILKYPLLYSSSLDKTIKVWSAVKETLEVTMYHETGIKFMDCHEAIMIAASEQDIYVWNLEDQKQELHYTESTLRKLEDLKFSGEKLVTLWEGRTVRLQRVEQKRLETERVFLNEECLMGVQFLFRDIIAFNHEQVFFFSLEDPYVLGRKVWAMKNVKFSCLSSSKFGMLVGVGSAQGGVYVLSLEYLGIQVFEFRFRNSIVDLQFISTDRLLITYSSNLTYVYDFRAKQVLREIQWHHPVTSVSVEGAMLSVVLDQHQIITQSFNINKCNLHYWQLQTKSLLNSHDIIAPLKVQTLYQTEKFHHNILFRKAFGLAQTYYPKFELVGETSLMRMAREVCGLEENYYVQRVWELVKASEWCSNTIAQVAHIVTYVLDSVEAFVEGCELLHSSQLGELVRSTFYEILQYQSSQGVAILQRILSEEKYSRHLTFHELQLLYSMAQFTSANGMNYKCIHEKLGRVHALNLRSNAYLNSKLYRAQLLKNLNVTYSEYNQEVPLISQRYNQTEPKYAKFAPARVQTTSPLLEQVVKLVDHSQLAGYDSFINAFLVNLATTLPCLRNLDFSELNLTDQFCIQFAAHFINRDHLPNLTIDDNPAITEVGLKYLEVLFQKHNYASLNQNYVREKVNPLAREYCLYCQGLVCADCHQEHTQCLFCYKCLKHHQPRRRGCQFQQVDDKAWLNQIYHDFYRYKRYCLKGNLRIYEKIRRREYRLYRVALSWLSCTRLGQKECTLRNVDYHWMEQLLQSRLLLVLFFLWQATWYLIVAVHDSYEDFNEYIFIIYTILSTILEVLGVYLLTKDLHLNVMFSMIRRYELMQLLLLRNSLPTEHYDYLQILLLVYSLLQFLLLLIRCAMRRQELVLRNVNFYTNLLMIYEYQSLSKLLTQISCSNMLGKTTQQRLTSCLSFLKSLIQILLCALFNTRFDRFILQSISLGGLSLISQLTDFYTSQPAYLNFQELSRYRVRIGFKYVKSNREADQDQQ